MAIRARADQLAPDRHRWIERNAYYYAEDLRYMRFLIPEGSSVLDLGCGAGDLLAGLKPSRGIGVDFSPRMIEEARRRYPSEAASNCSFVLGDIEDPAIIGAIEGQFDFIILSDTIGSLDDCEAMLQTLHRLCRRETRLVIAYYSHLWEPVLRLAETLHLKMPQERQNFLTTDDISDLMYLADFERVKREWRLLLPRRLLGIGTALNRFLAPLPGIRRLSLRNYVIGRSTETAEAPPRSASVIIPCRNERGNIAPAIERLPQFCDDIEIIFVEGHSKDATYEECLRVQAANPGKDIKVFRQDGKGKADAVWKGFDHARGDVLMILDADLTVPPEQIPKFWQALSSGKGEYINGSRLIYPMEDEAMRALNFIANRMFSFLFSFLLNQRFTDTLCGTKVLRRTDYLRLKQNRAYFGDFDPFGDFDLIFGSSKLNLKTVEVPIRYASRRYGETQISRFRHGWMLLKMVFFAYRKLKAF